jgi:hypothetical protein
MKANPPLIVDSDAPLTLATSFERLKAIASRNAQIAYRFCRMQKAQLAQGSILNVMR